MNFSELVIYLQQDADMAVPHALCEQSVETVTVQHGQTCKLAALRSAMLHTSQLFSDRPLSEMPPLCHSQNPEYKLSRSIKSIRSWLKNQGLSAVGEVPSTETLEQIGTMLDYTVEITAPSSLKEYCDTLKKLLHANLTPCVYFDVNISTQMGQPQITKETKKNEHSAVVVGYFYSKKDKKLHFILQQWGEYFVVNSVLLSASSSSLNLEPRAPEVFYKFDAALMHETSATTPQKPSWFNLADHSLPPETVEKILATNPQKRVTAKNRETSAGSFQSCILVVKPKRPTCAL